MRKKTNIVLLCCTMIFLMGVLHTFGQEKETKLKDKRITINAEKESLNYILRYLMSNYDIAVGFEQSALDKFNHDYEFGVNVPYEEKETILSGERPFDFFPRIEKHWFTVKAKNERLENILDIIVKQMPNYKWVINDGIVNIFPSQGRDKNYEKLLNIKIKSFTYQKQYPIVFIRNGILDLPEVKKFLEENNMLSQSARSYTGYSVKGLAAEMKFSNLTFRDLLNKITKAKRGGWMLLNTYVLPKSGEKQYLNIEI